MARYPFSSQRTPAELPAHLSAQLPEIRQLIATAAALEQERTEISSDSLKKYVTILVRHQLNKRLTETNLSLFLNDACKHKILNKYKSYSYQDPHPETQLQRLVDFTVTNPKAHAILNEIARTFPSFFNQTKYEHLKALYRILTDDDYRIKYAPDKADELDVNPTLHALSTLMGMTDPTPWLDRLSDDKFANVITFAIPTLILFLQNLTPWLENALKHMATMPPAAQCAVLDGMLLQGRLDETRQLIATLNPTHRLPDYLNARLAAALCLEGNVEQAAQQFQDIAPRLAKHKPDNRKLFASLPEFAFLLTAIHCHANHIPLTADRTISFLHYSLDCWDTILAPLRYTLIILAKHHVEPWFHSEKNSYLTTRGIRHDPWMLILTDQLATVCKNSNVNENKQVLTRLESIQQAAEKSTYPFIATLCQQLKLKVLGYELEPRELLHQVSVNTIWSWTSPRTGKDEQDDNAETPDGFEEQLIWKISVATSSFLYLSPFIQSRSKRGGWTKGRRAKLDSLTSYFISDKLYLTEADRKLLSLLKETFRHTYQFQLAYSKELVSCLQNIKRLFWEHNDRPCKPYMAKLKIEIRSAPNQQCQLLLIPKLKPEDLDRDYVSREDKDGNLAVYHVPYAIRNIYEFFPESMALPQTALKTILPKLMKRLPSLDTMANCDLRQPPENLTTVVPLLDLRVAPEDQGFHAQLVAKPFPHKELACIPLTGMTECLKNAPDGALTQLHRDSEAEKRLVNLFFKTFPNLDSTAARKSFEWTHLTLDDIYEITSNFPRLGNFCTLSWKDKPTLKNPRLIDFSKCNFRLKHEAQWLELEGEVHIDQEAVISFKQLLALAAQQKGKFITLNNGDIIQLTEQLRKQLALLNAMGIPKADGIRLNQFLTPVLHDELEDLIPDDQLPDTWKELTQSIRQAARRSPQLPADLAPELSLRDYQSEGFKWLSRLDAWKAGACLADDMGLGKTLQAIAFLVDKQDEGPAIVVAPTSVCPNWVSEIQRFAPTLTPLQFEANDRHLLLQSLTKRHVFITSYGLFQNEREAIEKITWRTAILDEAQAIKNSHTKRAQAARTLKATFRMVTTGTPIENNLSELWSIFQFILPGLLGSEEHFRNQFVIPIESLKDQDTAAHLNAIVRPFILRRKKQDVLKQLPPKTEIELKVQQTPKEAAFYEAIRQEQVRKVKQLDDPQASRISILAALTTLRQAACNPRLIAEDNMDVPSAKMDALQELLQQLIAGQHHVLIFSQFVRHLELVRQLIENLDIPYGWLTGSSTIDERKQAIKAFQANKTDVFLISLKAGGVGLNLTAADFVILMDPWWNPAVEDQAADRAHRFGQTKPVTIYRLVTQHTIEEKIIRLHADKKDLAEQILQETETSHKLSADDLLKLLTEE